MIIVFLGLLCIGASIMAGDIISRLGLKHSGAQTYLMANITGSFNADFNVKESVFFYPRITTLADIISGDEAAAAIDLCRYIRDYVNTREFLDGYHQKRANSRPTYEPEPMSPESLEGMRASIAELESQLIELKKSPGENAQSIALFEPMVAEQRASLAEYEDPTPNKTKWERNYPEDPAILVRRRLQEYLDLVATVDFNAQLTAPDKYKIRKFVNPGYEAKSPSWKACYRAGKEVNDAVTVFVKDWLKGEIVSGTKTRAMQDVALATAISDSHESPKKEVNKPTAPADDQQDINTSEETPESAKEKTGLLGKLKKAKAILKD